MKKTTVLILLVSLIFIQASAQKIKRIYFDSTWKECSKKHAMYYREKPVQPEHDSLFLVKDFFLNGQVQMEGHFSSFKPERKQGHFMYYYQNGQKSSETDYVNDLYNGKRENWYADGNKLELAWYINGKANGKAAAWFDNGKKKWEMAYDTGKRVGEVWEWYKTGDAYEHGYYVNDKDSGEHLWWAKDGKVISRFVVVNGKRIWSIVDPSAAEDYKAIYPAYQGGNDSLLNYLHHNIKYPQTAVDHSIQGTVYVSFYVDTLGVISDLKIQKGIGYGCDEEVLEVMKKCTKRWTPASVDGQLFGMIYTIPVKFTFK